MLSAVTTFSAFLRRQVVYSVCGCMLSMCVRVEFTTKYPTDKYIRHAHRQHTATYQINNLTQTSREVGTALSTKGEPLKMVKQL